MFALGKAYENGEGVDRDEEKALEWYQRAAEVAGARRQELEKWLATEDTATEDTEEWFETENRPKP